MKSKKASIEISYSWIFAIAAGAVIIFFAIYLSSKLMDVGQKQVSAKTGKEIQILLNPMETEFEEAQATLISIPSDTRINNLCSTHGTFGYQGLSIDQKSFNKWKEGDINVGFENKYIFSQQHIESRDFYVFSKPFRAPFKVADLFYFIPTKQRYCFTNTPNEIKEELNTLSQNQTYIVFDNCSNKDIRVCFNGERCNISVVILTANLGYVSKEGEEVYFIMNSQDRNSLMYASIFADKKVYECQIQRLMARLAQLAQLYTNKEDLIGLQGCENTLEANLGLMKQLAGSINSSSQLENLKQIIEDLNYANEARECKLW